MAEHEWKISLAENLHGREEALIKSFQEENRRFKKMIAFRVNPAGEYEGMIYGFIADIDELNVMPQNPSLWVPLGVMSNVGDFVIKYASARASGSFRPYIV